MKRVLKSIIGIMLASSFALTLVSCNSAKDVTTTTSGTTVHTHSWNDGVISKEATCSSEGEKIFTCSGCNETKKEVIPVDPSKHVFGETTYEWSADNTKCTATRVCTLNSAHIETETVNVTYDVETAATADNAGLGKYTATFTNTGFGKQIKKNIIPALGYVYDTDSITWDWLDDASKVTVTIPCKAAEGVAKTLDTNTPVVQELTSEITVSSRTNPTCEEKGNIVYNAEIAFNGVNFSDSKTVELATIPHDLEDEVTKIPTLTQKGEMTYKCSMCKKVIKTEELAMLTDTTDYSLKANLMANTPGVYSVKAGLGGTIDSTTKKPVQTIGIPSIAKQVLANYPTLESPAIVQGAQYGYETKTPGKVEYKTIEGAVSKSPYNKFPHRIIEETLTDADGKTSTHLKLSGFDGSYYIIRVDVSEIINGKSDGYYLHVKEDSNKALMVLVGVQSGPNSVSTDVVATTDATTGKYTNKPVAKEDGYWYFGDTKTNFTTSNNKDPFVDFWGNWSFNPIGFGDGLGSKTASYSLANNGEMLKDAGMDTPYVDVIVMSSGKLVAGADTGTTNAFSSDISLTMYVDQQEVYSDLEYDPAAPAPADTSQPTHEQLMLQKYYDDTKLTAENGTAYLVKGSDLEIDVATYDNVDNANDISKYWDPSKEYWSLTNAISYQQYNNHIIKLICEVPVLEALLVEGTEDNKRTIIFDVNSFDIQIANHATTGAAALTVANNATLKLTDSTRTSGAELAVGNNAKLEVKAGGTLIVDEPCQLEVEYDAATITQTTPDQTLPDYDNGVITVENGGRLINYGVINIEGIEFKPLQNNTQEQSQGQQTITSQKMSALHISNGAVLDNYGCISLKGELYVLGTLNNYGKYTDTIAATDPDKGTIYYHRGIQVTWKDDVTSGQTADANGKYAVNEGATGGELIIGLASDGTTKYMDAVVNNYGDIVLVPGNIRLYASLCNLTHPTTIYNGHVYICDITEVVVPITPTQAAPTVTEERRQLKEPFKSVFDQKEDSTFEGTVTKASVHAQSNGILGDLTVIVENNQQ